MNEGNTATGVNGFEFRKKHKSAEYLGRKRYGIKNMNHTSRETHERTKGRKHFFSNRAKKAFSVFLALIILGIASLLLFLATQKPSHDRDWELGQEKLPRILIKGDRIMVENLRDFHWTGPFEAQPNYIDAEYSLDQMRTVDVVISHFDEFEGLAHIFLSFGFSDGRHVSISIETRREAGETFSPWLGMLRQFEIIYVVGTDNDLMGVRTGPREERVYIYPTKASPEQVRNLFEKLAQDVNALYKKPIFYNTLIQNCTNRLTRRVEEVSDVKFPFTYKSVLPGYFDEVLYDMRIIKTRGSFEETKKNALVDNAKTDFTDSDYSEKVRFFLLAVPE